jgi:mannan polymerase II complex ANP1 subunit
MSAKPSKTVLITGGNGALGSHIAFEIAKTHPEAFFILTSRRENDVQAQKITAQLHSKGVTAFEFLTLNLASFASVKAFAAKVAEKVRSKTIPPVAVQVNSAAYSSYEMDEKTVDGFDPVYQTNVLSPFLLTVLLLEAAFQMVDGAPRGKIIYITSETVSMGKVDFFDSWGPTEQMPVGSSLPVMQGLTRYGSSKLLGDLTMYTLREKLLAVRHLLFIARRPSHVANV